MESFNLLFDIYFQESFHFRHFFLSTSMTQAALRNMVRSLVIHERNRQWMTRQNCLCAECMPITKQHLSNEQWFI